MLLTLTQYDQTVNRRRYCRVCCQVRPLRFVFRSIFQLDYNYACAGRHAIGLPDRTHQPGEYDRWDRVKNRWYGVTGDD